MQSDPGSSPQAPVPRLVPRRSTVSCSAHGTEGSGEMPLCTVALTTPTCPDPGGARERLYQRPAAAGCGRELTAVGGSPGREVARAPPGSFFLSSQLPPRSASTGGRAAPSHDGARDSRQEDFFFVGGWGGFSIGTMFASPWMKEGLAGPARHTPHSVTQPSPAGVPETPESV